MGNKKDEGASDANGNRGKRYTNVQKLRVVNFVKNYNARHGRGGLSHAVTKFGISQLTISSWLRSPVIEAIDTKVSEKKCHSLDSALKKRVQDLLDVCDQMRKLDGELSKLRAKYEAIRYEILKNL